MQNLYNRLRDFRRQIDGKVPENQLVNKATVLFLYNMMLGREASDGDYRNLSQHYSTLDVVQRIFRSVEFQEHILKLLEDGQSDSLSHVKSFGSFESEIVAPSLMVITGGRLRSNEFPKSWDDLIRMLSNWAKQGQALYNLDHWESASRWKNAQAASASRASPASAYDNLDKVKSAIANKLYDQAYKAKKKTEHLFDLTLKAPALTPEESELIDAQFKCVLGRHAPQNVQTPDRLKDGFQGGLRMLVRAFEFERNVVDGLMNHDALPHHSIGSKPPKGLLDILASNLTDKPFSPEKIKAAKTWPELFNETFCQPQFFEETLNGFDKEHATILRAKLSNLLQRTNKTPQYRFALSGLNLDRKGTLTATFANMKSPANGVVKIFRLNESDPFTQVKLKRHSDGAVGITQYLDIEDVHDTAALVLRYFDVKGLEKSCACLRLKLPHSQQKKALKTVLKDMLKTKVQTKLSDLDMVISKDPLAIDPRLYAAEIIASTSKNPGVAIDYLDWIAPISPPAQSMLARLKAAQGEYETSAQMLSGMKTHKTAKHFVNYLADNSRSGVPAWYSVFAEILRNQKTGVELKPDTIDALSRLEEGDINEGLATFAWMMMPMKLCAQIARSSDSERFKSRAKLLLGKLSEIQKPHFYTQVPPELLTDKKTLMAAAENLIILGRFREATAYADKALYRYPDQNDVKRIYGYAHRGSNYLGDKKRAVSMFSSLFEDNPNDTRARDIVGDLYAEIIRRDPLYESKAGQRIQNIRISEAVSDVLRAPTKPGVRSRLAELLVQEERYQEAYDIVSSALEDAEEDERLLRLMLRCCDQLKLPQEQLEYSKTLMKVRPNDFAAISYIKACREVGKPQDAEKLPANVLEVAQLPLLREMARNKFFTEDFKGAELALEKLALSYPDDIELRLLKAATALENKNPERLEELISQMEVDLESTHFLEVNLQSYALQYLRGNFKKAVSELKPLYNGLGCQALTLSDPEEFKNKPDGLFDRLMPTGEYPEIKSASQVIGTAPVFDGPLVSVVMTAYEATQYIETSIRSILDQSYKNIELIVVNDCSPDETGTLLKEIERKHPNVRVINKTTNDGTYVSKNMGILQARGKYIALQDSDDWSHPDRIAKSVAALEENKNLMGLTTDWLRMTTDGEIIIKAGGQISHVCCISLVFRRDEVISKLGFFDSVRIEADMEYIRRMALVFGKDSIARLRWPLLFGRAHSASLTASEEFGITRTGFTEPRVKYQAAQRKWHEKISAKQAKPFMAFPLETRNYDAPAIILPEREKAKKK